GRVCVTWQLVAEGQTLEIAWTERGGPIIAGPPSRRGFGSMLLERGLAHQLHGEVDLDFAPEGLCFRIRVNLATESPAALELPMMHSSRGAGAHAC
ncbi:MAG: hypothetical protein M3Y41_17060, partial [Pseudomonadota bacterium]|nr:hypothetical protein [Pseudomonadota bacterium]